MSATTLGGPGLFKSGSENASIVSLARIAALIAVVLAFGLGGLAASAAPKPPSGIKIDRRLGSTLGTVQEGTCKLRGGTFHFSAANDNFSLYVRINGWKGFGHRYLFTTNSKGGVHVTDNYGNGYDTSFRIPGSKAAGVAAFVLFHRNGATISVGAPDLPNRDFSDFLKIKGEAACT